MNKYVDRGIIKWSPFDGLAGFNDMFTELRNRLTRMDKPVLLDDRLEELDLALQAALNNDTRILFEYFNDGHIRYTEGTILKIDTIHHIVMMDTKQRISIQDILNIHEIQAE
jgi:hypothetical protein